LLALIGAESRICSYFDIPLQHASDSMLAAMRRGHTARDAYTLIDRIRTSVPDAAIRTAFILGFPGETPAQVSELVSFIERVRFDKLGVFPFSPEQGTAAADMRPRPRTNTAIRRCEEIMALQRDISRELLERRIGGSMRVIIDRVADNPDYVFAGRTYMDAPEVDGVVHLVRCSAQPGDIIDAEIIDADDYDLFARAP
jgi:ribosomal protein S12 methylthiotransferase